MSPTISPLSEWLVEHTPAEGLAANSGVLLSVLGWASTVVKRVAPVRKALALSGVLSVVLNNRCDNGRIRSDLMCVNTDRATIAGKDREFGSVWAERCCLRHAFPIEVDNCTPAHPAEATRSQGEARG